MEDTALEMTLMMGLAFAGRSEKICRDAAIFSY